MLKTAIPFAAAAAAWLLLKGAGVKQAVTNLTTEIVAAKRLRFTGLTELSTAILIRFTNPTSTPVTFRGVVLNVFYKDTQIGTVINNTGATIPGTSQTRTEFPFTINLLAVGGALISQLRNGGKLGAVRFTGFLQAAGIDIPVDMSYPMPEVKV